MRMIATKPLRYGTRRLQAGDHFDAKNERDARILSAVKKARAINDREPETLSPPPASLTRKAAKHTPPADEKTKALREKYEAVLGKRPFNGWDGAELERRIAEHETPETVLDPDGNPPSEETPSGAETPVS